jgi:hypothetical protein
VNANGQALAVWLGDAHRFSHSPPNAQSGPGANGCIDKVIDSNAGRPFRKMPLDHTKEHRSRVYGVLSVVSLWRLNNQTPMRLGKSRPPRGGRHVTTTPYNFYTWFQSTPPAWGATQRIPDGGHER